MTSSDELGAKDGLRRRQAQTALSALRSITGSPTMGEIDQDLPFVQMGSYAEYLVDELMARRTTPFPALFAEVERLLCRGSSGERYFAIVGFIEDVQNATLRASLPLSIWAPWLLKETATAWAVVERSWNDEISSEEFNRFVEEGVEHNPSK